MALSGADAHRPAVRVALWLGGAAVATGLLVLLRPYGPLAEAWWLSMGAVAAVLVADGRRRTPGAPERDAIGGAVVAAAAVIGLRIARYAYAQALDPLMWDFDAFWLSARVATAGLGFYDPAAYHALAGPLRDAPEFAAEILNVGYWYPPPSMLFVAPIGLLDRGAAGVVWVATVFAALVASVIALWRAFFGDRGAAGLGMAALLVFVEHGARLTLFRSQTNFLLLFWIVLFWCHRGRRLGGLWLALAILIKPIAAVLYVDVLARRNRGAFAVSLAALAVATAGTAALFGWGQITAYLTANPMGRLPEYVFMQEVNQSAPGLVMRVLGAADGPARALAVGLAVLIAAATAIRALDRRADEGLRFGLLIAGGMLAYPGTLGHYSVLLVVPIILLWERRAIVPGGAPLTLGVAAGAYALMVGVPGGVLAATALTWAVLIASSAPRGEEPAHVHRPGVAGAGAR